jgi:hypothetical protein
MLPNHPRSPFTRAQHILGHLHRQGDTLQPPHSPRRQGPLDLEREAETLLRVLWSRIKQRYSNADREEALAACWSIVGLGCSIEDLDEAFLVFDLLCRYGDRVGAFDIREAARVLGHQADLFLEPWVRGLHQQLTGTHDFPVALWEHASFLRATPEGERFVREQTGLPALERVTGPKEEPDSTRSPRPSNPSYRR